METSRINPLRHDQVKFINLSTATVAPSDDLLKAFKVGGGCIPVSQIKRKSTIPRQAKEIVGMADRSLVGQLLIIAQSRQLHMKDVLSYPLGPLLWELANGNGSLWKTYKAVLARELEKLASPSPSPSPIPSPSFTS